MSLASRFPTVLWLGDDLVMVYNDGYIPMLADKHPWAMGTPGLDVWWEIRDIIEPMLRGVVETGVATWSDDLLLPLVDKGRSWEKYFTFTYSPIFLDDGDVGGVFCAVAETTERVVGERRLRTLNAVGAALVESHSVDATIAAALGACSEHPADLPFVAFYRFDHQLGDSRLSGASPLVAEFLASAAPLLSCWATEGTARADVTLVDDLPDRVPGLVSAWDSGAPEQALILPLSDTTSPAVGAMVIGLNPNRPLDEQYVGFCRLLADQVTAGIASARAYEEERKRAESLAELDRAKTLFLTNVSHEFRTPLTLMLGPLDDALAMVGNDPELSEQLEAVRRSSRRLLRLVNSLLDFARIEAGRASPKLVTLDVGALTADIASSFSDVCQRAGLGFDLDCQPVIAQVDAEMWETVVLNLVSNAFKYTFSGSIAVRLQPAPDGTFELSVSDTGIGIPERELPRVFERFYRPDSSQGRSAEGSGIGLALVQDLVSLHGGAVSVRSVEGQGTTFTVQLPLGEPSDDVTSGPRRPDENELNVYATEAAQWLAGASGDAYRRFSDQDLPAAIPERPLVLIADDNADLRAHLERIVGSRWNTIGASDGQTALELVRLMEPDLIIADVMMPRLDGFGLIKAIRADPALDSTPIMILSARAGAEATGEGFSAGADDYLVKPFRSSDVLNRVAARLEVATRERARREEEAARVRRASIFAELGSVLSSASSPEEIVKALTGPALRPLAPDSAAIGLIEGDAGLLRMSFAGAMVPEFTDRYHAVALDAPFPVAQVARSGLPMVIGDTLELVAAYGTIVSDAATSIRSAVLEPLRGPEGAVKGALALSWLSPRQFSDFEVGVVEQIAVMISKTLERIERITEERQVAVTLQERLLEWGTHSTAAAIAAEYHPASDVMRVGGDWYTVTTLDRAGRLGLSVGDVGGHGLAAATIMSELRSALAVAALAAAEPGEVLDLLDRYARQIPGAHCTTTAYAVFDPERRSIDYLCAGHPYPLLVHADGRAQLLEGGRRPPLAASSMGSRGHEASVELGSGALLVLYTDGLIERRGESLDVGLARLCEAGRSLLDKPVSEVCAELISRLQPPAGYEDDVVVVALRPCGSAESRFTEVLRSRMTDVPALRAQLRGWLGGSGVPAEALHNILLTTCEAVNNAIEHGSGGDPDRTVTVEAFRRDRELCITVSDTGRWDADSSRSRRSTSRGRGLTLIHGLSSGVDIERTRAGTAVTMRHLLLGAR